MTEKSSSQGNPSSDHHNPDMPGRGESGAPPEAGRDAKGRFTKNNPGGPGNPFARQVAALRQEFLKAASKEDMAEIARVMIAKAKEGDAAAAKIVLQYTLGRPAEAVDPDRLDEGEWQQWQREVVHTREVDAVFEGCAAETICKLARTYVPLKQRKMLDGMVATAQEREAARQKRETTSGKRETTSKRRETASRDAPGEHSAEGPKGAVEGESPVELQKAEQSGQSMSAESREDVVARVQRMLNGNVNKRQETARRAANDSPD